MEKGKFEIFIENKLEEHGLVINHIVKIMEVSRPTYYKKIKSPTTQLSLIDIKNLANAIHMTFNELINVIVSSDKDFFK